MTSISESSDAGRLWPKLAALLLVVAAVGLPVNNLYAYALLLLATVAVFAGRVSRDGRAWLAAAAIVAVAVLAQVLWASPRIEEGHNVFIVDAPGGALERELPAEAYRLMAAEFDATYPPGRRCESAAFGCWRGLGFPDHAFAFSADGILQRPAYSRRVTGIDFEDPIWLRLGFVNDRKYNWTGASDLLRGVRERGLWRGLHPWRLTMPHFVMYRFPPEFAGSRLCWRGEVLWEGADQHFTRWQHREAACRPIEPADIGRRIFGVSIASPLAMTLEAPIGVQLRRLLEPGAALLGFAAVLLLLVRWRRRQLAVPLAMIGLSLVVIALNDITFIGGVRPFEGGDDGLVHEGMGRRITQHLLAGEFAAAFEGVETIYYFVPGLRYFRSLEHFIFGDSFLGYLSLALALPFVALAIFRRFFSPGSALALTLVFIAIPVGALFGSSFFHYSKWAARGFADSAGAILFLAGFIVLIGRTTLKADTRAGAAVGAALLLAMAVWMRPNLVPGAAVLLAGAGLAALWHRHYLRLLGLCIGFAPVLGMALHNWMFGHVVVPFSRNAGNTELLLAPPAVYLAALGDLIRLDFAAGNLGRVASQLVGWLSGPSGSPLLAPLHAVAVGVVAWVGCRRRYEPALRLTAAAALALHAVALFYPPYDRYHLPAWFLTFLICAVWVRDEGWDLLRRWLPRLVTRYEQHPARLALSRQLDRWSSGPA